MFKPYSYEKQYNSFYKENLHGPLGFSSPKSAIALFLIAGGIFVMLTKVLLPVVQIQADTDSSTPIISPMLPGSSANLVAESSEQAFSFKELSPGFRDSVEYSQTEKILPTGQSVPDHFYISVPKLGIKNAKVDTNSTNLDPQKALGHYNGSCLPDEACNTFIFGHSTFRNVKNKYEEGDYTAVFSRLDELEYGDEFSIKYNGKEYRYLVELSKVQRPENVNPLESPIPKSLGKHKNTVELFTCVPPGTTKYRLSVIGKLVD